MILSDLHNLFGTENGFAATSIQDEFRASPQPWPSDESSKCQPTEACVCEYDSCTAGPLYLAHAQELPFGWINSACMASYLKISIVSGPNLLAFHLQLTRAHGVELLLLASEQTKDMASALACAPKCTWLKTCRNFMLSNISTIRETELTSRVSISQKRSVRA